MYDTKLPFGARKSVEIFHRLSQAVKRFMAKRGHVIIVYIDDFLVVTNSRAECQLIAERSACVKLCLPTTTSSVSKLPIFLI